VLPFRWWYVWTLFMVAIAPIVLWIKLPVAFAAAAVLTLAGIYTAQLWGARIRIGLLKWGRVATVTVTVTVTDTDTETLSRATYYSGTTWYNVNLPMAHGWTVTRQRWSGPNSKTKVSYTLDGHPGDLVVRGRKYADGVILADERHPARACCVTALPMTSTATRPATGSVSCADACGWGWPAGSSSTDAISSSGTGNAVIYQWGTPQIANAGTSNTVQQG
jgi:hypothetical protein